MSLVSQRYTLTQAPNTSCNEHSHGKAGEYIQNILLNIADPIQDAAIKPCMYREAPSRSPLYPC